MNGKFLRWILYYRDFLEAVSYNYTCVCVCVAKEFVLACSQINCRQSGVLFALILSDAYTFDIPSIDAVK